MTENMYELYQDQITGKLSKQVLDRIKSAKEDLIRVGVSTFGRSEQDAGLIIEKGNDETRNDRMRRDANQNLPNDKKDKNVKPVSTRNIVKDGIIDAITQRLSPEAQKKKKEKEIEENKGK